MFDCEVDSEILAVHGPAFQGEEAIGLDRVLDNDGFINNLLLLE